MKRNEKTGALIVRCAFCGSLVELDGQMDVLKYRDGFLNNGGGRVRQKYSIRTYKNKEVYRWGYCTHCGSTLSPDGLILRFSDKHTIDLKITDL